MYYEDSDPNGRATHFNFISPSITTYSFTNPAYRIYTIDGGYEGATYVSFHEIYTGWNTKKEMSFNTRLYV